ncbi:Rieske (2Fe-2S) protein [Streptomyces resistomycificus]|uniref:Cytochrome bc1 complex Rieske iron-sulfur subunit n=1 Tax=Streptomyces resistomycificus TaxID=67356 RepID=A0A0L8L176_9ACTN|nr:Rieske (2Fe-2S) protein [Streptomyces resistomycificus]KOG32008.1 iron-sulfur protein [Streptomyces resistomycificus]KUO00477.1 iron-sulfur protein [Streptomyces resistomycificus]
MTSEALPPVGAPSRRTVVAAVGAAGIAAALSSCGSDEGSSGTVIGKTSDIPEGGGKIFKKEGVVVTQPSSGTFKAFSSKCTHQGCAVTSVANGVIVCPCHNSEFSVTDGSVKKGPATQALPAAKITVSGDSIELT